MPYEYIDEITIADVAFRARGRTLEELFRDAADATTGAMVENLDGIGAKDEKRVSLSAGSLDMLLFQLLQELIFYKDAEQLLLRVGSVSLRKEGDLHSLDALLVGHRNSSKMRGLGLRPDRPPRPPRPVLMRYELKPVRPFAAA